MGRKYAEGTSVPVPKTRAEIEMLLERYGATGFMSGKRGHEAMVGFQVRGLDVLMRLHIPDERHPRIVKDRGGNGRTPLQREMAMKAEERRLWRCLLILIKAKFESVDSEITTFEVEFLPYIMIGGQTVGEALAPKLEAARDEGALPGLPFLG